MEVVYRCCCGIDVHKKLIVACLNEGGRQEVREFGDFAGGGGRVEKEVRPLVLVFL